MSSSRTKNTRRWTSALRGPWTVACAVVTVVVGPAAATASALDRANAAPPYHAREAKPGQTYHADGATHGRTPHVSL